LGQIHISNWDEESCHEGELRAEKCTTADSFRPIKPHLLILLEMTEKFKTKRINSLLMGTNYNNLDVFQLSYKFVLDLYPHLDKFPEGEDKNLVLQMKRAAVSIPMNIAEGSGRRRESEFLPFLSYALGSAKEVEVALKLSKDLGFLNKEAHTDLDQQLQECIGKLVKLMQYLEVNVAKRKEVLAGKISRGEKPW